MATSAFERVLELARNEAFSKPDTEEKIGDEHARKAQRAYREKRPFLQDGRSSFQRRNGEGIQSEGSLFQSNDPNTIGLYTTRSDQKTLEVGYAFRDGYSLVEVLFGENGHIERHGIFIKGREPVGDPVLGEFDIVTGIIHIMLQERVPIDSNLGIFMMDELDIYYQ
ncbi:MAG: hypothetical protein HY430_02750 [Candidatus Levybacteria bacterium]|nr:hypothetical protein [Candidatus Levybacteria bacterium]